jgi:hypothetical protein
MVDPSRRLCRITGSTISPHCTQRSAVKSIRCSMTISPPQREQWLLASCAFHAKCQLPFGSISGLAVVAMIAPFVESSTTHRRPAPGLAAPQSPLVALAMVLNLNHLHFDRTSTIPQGEGQQKDQWEKVTCVYQHPTHMRSLSRPSQARCIVIISPSNRSYA